MEAGGLEVQSHPQQHGKFKTCLGDTKLLKFLFINFFSCNIILVIFFFLPQHLLDPPPSLYPPKVMFFLSPKKKKTQTNNKKAKINLKQNIRTKIPKGNKKHTKNMEFLLCWSTPPGPGAVPECGGYAQGQSIEKHN